VINEEIRDWKRCLVKFGNIICCMEGLKTMKLPPVFCKKPGTEASSRNLESLIRQDKKETIDLVTKYADYFESMSPLDAVARDVSEQQLFVDDWSNLGSEDLRMLIEVVWYRKNNLCSMDKDPRMTPDENETSWRYIFKQMSGRSEEN
jgi:hypothetical protein